MRRCSHYGENKKTDDKKKTLRRGKLPTDRQGATGQVKGEERCFSSLNLAVVEKEEQGDLPRQATGVGHSSSTSVHLLPLNMPAGSAGHVGARGAAGPWPRPLRCQKSGVRICRRRHAVGMGAWPPAREQRSSVSCWRSGRPTSLGSRCGCCGMVKAKPSGAGDGAGCRTASAVPAPAPALGASRSVSAATISGSEAGAGGKGRRSMVARRGTQKAVRRSQLLVGFAASKSKLKGEAL
jgi:hypothetical protein